MTKIFVIAEIGINHNGDLSIAKQLIDIALETKCNAVKFQKREIDLVYEKEFSNYTLELFSNNYMWDEIRKNLISLRNNSRSFNTLSGNCLCSIGASDISNAGVPSSFSAI